MELVATKNVPDTRGRLSRGSGVPGGGGAGPGGGGPFQRHDVREWSHMDKLTGMLERARVETGHWAANTKDASHKYGKVVDSRARSAADGNVQQRQHKQLEVFQSRSATGGSLQVIRTQTRTSSRWSSNSTTTSSSLFGGNSALKSKNKTTSVPAIKDADDGFENLQLSINPLDLTSQKSRASVGRSGSISTRRPPSRPRSIVDKTFNEATDDLSKLSHISSDNTANKISNNLTSRLSTSSNDNEENNDTVDENDRFKELTHNSSIYNNEKYTLTRTKSNSSDDINCVPERETSNDDDSIDWKRTSVIRRSFQFPRQTKYVPISRPTDLPDLKGTVSKIKQDLETGKRLNTAFRGNNVDLYAIDQILKTISPTTSISSDLINKHVEIPERDTQIAPKPLKVDPSKHTFITAQSLQEVRSKLRHLNSSLSEEVEKEKSDDTDDGIVAEDTTLKIDEDAINMEEHKQSNLRPYIFGMEIISRKPVNGTGSLESNKSNKNCNVSRTEDWYNRRKSYGFEQVGSQEVEQSSYISFREKNKVESSTDSGICRSSETVTPSMKIGLGLKNSDLLDSHKISKYFTPSSEIKEHVEEFDSRKKTFVELTSKWNKRTSINSISNDSKNVNVSSPVTITIPVTNKDSWESTNGLKKSGFEACWKNKIILGNTDVSTRLETKWPITATEKQEQKRHSIAADEYNYLKNTVFETKKNISDNNVNSESSSTHLVPVEEDSQQNKRNKRVEFCKTEVHFAAESGKVNIVETDEKPPPTQNFRRRRRNSGGALASSLENINKNINLPLMHFGDVLPDKKLFGLNENSENNENKTRTESDTKPERHISSTLLTTETENIDKYGLDNDSQLRGILKSAPIKPKLKAYHLGENQYDLTDPSSSNIWGVRLRPVLKSNNQLLDSLIMSKSINEANETEIKSISTGFQSVLRLSNITEDENVNSSILEEKPVSMRRSSWSVADRVKQVENLQWSETNGYSTKVNIGENDGEENDIESSKDNNKIIEESKPINDFVSNKEKTYKVPVRAIKKSLSDSNCSHYIDNIVKENKSVAKQPPIVGKLQNLTSPSLIGASVNYEKGTRNLKTSSISSNVITRAKKDSFTNELLRKQTVSQDIDLLRNNRQAKQNSVFSVRNSVYENQNSVKKSTIQPIRSCCRNRVTERKSSLEKTNKINTESNYLSNKPDLLCHGVDNKNIFNKNERLVSNVRKIHRDSPIPMTERSQSPVYQNIDTIVKHSYKTTEMIENEKKILDELTRAADEILQAVNGYTDEESFKFNTTDDDDELKKYKYGRKNSEVLETISESNSLKINKNDNKKMNLSQKGPERVRICQASSTSSLDSVGSEHRRSLSLKKEENKYENVTLEKTRTKSLQNSTQAAKTTRTRRLLQRASSKEALLHSNGSSSEDISAIRENARKQRVVRRTKTSSDGSVTASSIVRSKRTNLQTDSKNLKTIVEGRPKIINTNSTAKPEIHHKIVVSTIKSVSDKSNMRGKSKSETQHQHSVTRSSRPTTARVRSVQRSDKQNATTVRAERIVTSGSNVLSKSQRTERSMVKR